MNAANLYILPENENSVKTIKIVALFTGTPLNLIIADTSSKELKNKNPTSIFPFIE